MKVEGMTNDEYAYTQFRLMTIASIVASMDIKGFLERIDTCDAIAPILDPTVYRQGAGRLAQIRVLAQSALALQKAALCLGKEGTF